MKLFKKILPLSVCFFIGIGIGFLLQKGYEKSTFKAWEWEGAPIIANCYGEDFNELYIIRGVDYWALRGEKIAFIEQNPSEKTCANEFLDGFILIKKKNLDEPTLAMTERKLQIPNIRAATIYFNPGTFKLENLIEHELGHAFGYGHLEEEGHIMHPEYEKIGKKFYIPD